VLLAAIAGYLLYNIILKPNVWTPDDESVAITIPTGTDYEGVKNIIYSQGLIINRKYFEWLAEKKNYPQLVKPGKYLINNKMNNNDLLNMLRSGDQEPVQLIFNNIRGIYQLAGKVSTQIEADSVSIVDLLTDSALRCFGSTSKKSIAPMATLWSDSLNSIIKRACFAKKISLSKRNMYCSRSKWEKGTVILLRCQNL